MTDIQDHFVYWLLNADGDCIYVGSTFNLERRWQEHYRRLGDEIATRRAAGPFTRKAALAMELAEIKRITPKHNGHLKSLPQQFCTWGADTTSTPDEDVWIAWADCYSQRLRAKRRARESAEAAS